MTELVKGNYKYITELEYKRLCIELTIEEQENRKKNELLGKKTRVFNRVSNS
jgi:hypothetical protein|tara:strand:- start:695 stop:850 length:156 start_codon:yes stop_codon:yes gene_type:complete